MLIEYLYAISDAYLEILKSLFSLNFTTGVGGYSYLYEPLWWAGMITSK